MINRAVLIGRLTNDPELRTTSSGLSVTSFCIAVDDGYGDRKTTDFINIVCWRGTADFVTRNFKKGQMIALDGKIKTRNYEDNKGNKRTAVEVVADNVSFCGDKPAENISAGFDAPDYDGFAVEDNDDGLPF